MEDNPAPKEGPNFEEVWQSSVTHYSKQLLRSMSDSEFNRLREAVFNRLRSHGFTRKFANEKSRKLVRVRRGVAKFRLDDLNYIPAETTLKKCTILEKFFPKREQKWLPIHKRKLIQNITLNEFSFIDSPNETINQLLDIARFEGICKSARMTFQDSQVLDIAPYVVLGILGRNMTPFIHGGGLTRSNQKVLDAVGLRAFLKFEPFSGLHNHDDIWAFKLRQRHKAGTSKIDAGDSITFQKVADELVDALNRWLGALPEPRMLSREAMAKVANMATETLNNAERHGREFGDSDWYMAGFMARREIEPGEKPDAYELDHWYECHLAFVNVGRTISEAVTTTPHQQILDDLLAYSDRHKQRSRGRFRSAETLKTAFAMQDGISSKPDNMGGKGMMEIVEVTGALAYDNITSKEPNVTIISGKSCIQFSGKYCGFHKPEDPKRGRVQYFNDEQSVESAPSEDHVYDLDNQFPGTIVAIRFALDPEAMEPRK